jgi:hemerythrin-like domain-containing protein
MNILEKRLRKDHSRIKMVLACLQYQLDCYGSERQEAPNLGLVLEAINYIQAYPEKWHHPLEDVIFSELQKRKLDKGGTIAALRIEHQRLEHQSNEVFELFYSLANDCVVPVELLKAKTQAMIDAQTRHMSTENVCVYPLMDKHFSEKDWNKMGAKVGDVHDPLFGSLLREDFSDLYQFILDKEAGTQMKDSNQAQA